MCALLGHKNKAYCRRAKHKPIGQHRAFFVRSCVFVVLHVDFVTRVCRERDSETTATEEVWYRSHETASDLAKVKQCTLSELPV